MKTIPIEGLPIDTETPPPREMIDSPPRTQAESPVVHAKPELRTDPRTGAGAKALNSTVPYSTVLLCSMEADPD